MNFIELPPITDTLTIDGSTVTNLTINGPGGYATNTFTIGSGAAVTITHLVITNGLGDGPDCASSCSGIDNNGGVLTVIASTLKECYHSGIINWGGR
ncbi:MAG: hypothetical protein L0331_05205 [Chloroflexi bacterium]|nr:hypothetical protein [Chloroflexota bacterium]MCI0645075.1 hypothetical protein [Chloroflexota bacterium]